MRTALVRVVLAVTLIREDFPRTKTTNCTLFECAPAIIIAQVQVLQNHVIVFFKQSSMWR